MRPARSVNQSAENSPKSSVIYPKLPESGTFFLFRNGKCCISAFRFGASDLNQARIDKTASTRDFVPFELPKFRSKKCLFLGPNRLQGGECAPVTPSQRPKALKNTNGALLLAPQGDSGAAAAVVAPNHRIDACSLFFRGSSNKACVAG